MQSQKDRTEIFREAVEYSNCPISAWFIVDFHSKMLFFETWNGKIPIFPTKVFLENITTQEDILATVWFGSSVLPLGSLLRRLGLQLTHTTTLLGRTNTPKAQCFQILTRMDSGAFFNSLPWHCPFQPPHLSFSFFDTKH